MIFIVTNRKLVTKASIYDVIERCLKSGADGVILREKDLSSDQLLSIAEKLKEITDRYNVPLIINGNEEVAKKVKAFAYHCGFNSFNKYFKNRELKLGLSIHSLDEAIQAEKLGADYIIAGNIFETDCKPGLKGKGLDFIENITKNISIPVFAIGGINIKNVNTVLNAGATGVAVMSTAMTDYDGNFIKNLKEEVERAHMENKN